MTSDLRFIVQFACALMDARAGAYVSRIAGLDSTHGAAMTNQEWILDAR